MTAATVLVPWRSRGCPHRTAAWRFVRDRYEQAGWQVLACDDGGDPFSRGCSINEGATRADSDVLVIADADIVVGLDRLTDAVLAASAAPGVVVAFENYRYLTAIGTRSALVGRTEVWDAQHRFNLAGSVGPCIAVSAATFADVGGFDSRFRGWGFEDIAFEVAAAALIAPTRYIAGTAYHLWHPTDRTRPAENAELAARYLAARTDPDLMRDLVAEAQCATPA